MHAHDVITLNVPMSYAAVALGAFQVFFIVNHDQCRVRICLSVCYALLIPLYETA